MPYSNIRHFTFHKLFSLGGIGMELVEWLLQKGARRIHIAVRAQNQAAQLQPYQRSRLLAWKRTWPNANVHIEQVDLIGT